MARDLQGLPKLAQWLGFEKGYKSSSPKEEGGDYMAAGSENVMLTGTGKTQAFKGMLEREDSDGGIVMMNVAERYASIGQVSDTTAYGNAFNVYASLFYIGKGLLRLAGESLMVTASATLSLLIKRSGGYTDPESGPWQAGLAQPSAPVIYVADPTPGGFVGKVNGVVAVVIWRIRSTTGAVSIHSESSNIVAATNQAIAVQIPYADANGQDYWGIGVTRNAEGRVGSFFELTEIPETEVVAHPDSSSDRTIVIEWRDGDLIGKEFAPFRDYPPPNGLFGGAIEDIVFVDGCYADAESATSSSVRGSAIAPSEPGKPESFSPDSVIFTNDIPTALVRGDGLYWRFGRNSCYVIRYLGGEKPLSVEIAWEGLGIEHQHNAAIGEGGRLYVWPNERGPMRMDQLGQVDGAFATDVADDLAPCTDPLKRVIGWDGKLQVVAFCYETRIWPWFTALELWGAPAEIADQIEGSIRSCVTENGILLISDTADNLYEYNAGTGSIMKVRTGWAISQRGMDNVALIETAVRADNVSDITIETFADGDETDVVSSIEVRPTRTGYQRLPSVWPNVQDCESYAVQVTIESTTESGDCGVESITAYGDAHSMLR